MKRRLYRIGLALSLGCLAGSQADAALITVVVENLAPANGNFLTPAWVGFHDGGFDLYDIGVAASPGLERIAEDGTTGPLSGEFLGSGAGTVDGVIAPGGPFAPGNSAMMTFNLDGSQPSNRYLSYASMVIPSNDAFIGNGDPIAHQIFDAGGNFLGADFIVLGAAVRDAGTEVNDEVPANTAFLAQAAPDTGVPEGGTVQVHGGFIPAGNILTAYPGADFTAQGYQVARIRVVPEPGTLALLAIGLLALLRKPTFKT
jgi:hypothetical protein